ncbi:hypothetical protein [Asticcacaulis sp. AND118]|uniref:hypothetical protein n=1 Tax=Asticcacaulis sp. AND118 TaxID=2840468 RepID=UPI001CFFAFB3|nr:hypothetical protein [Asticcacaulis sp. AND118]UDF05487.1 hypothetical protein LH365_14905 [Asticcacaulis sp. AND118]
MTPEQRRKRLRAFADRMLIALGEVDDPENGDDVVKGVRTALMIERLYARCDASEAGAHKRAAASIEDQVTLQKKLKWSGYYFDKVPNVPFVTLKPDMLAGMQWPRPEPDPMAELRGELKAEIQTLKTPAKPQPQPVSEPTKAPETVIEPKPAAPSNKPQDTLLTPQQAALRERVLNTKAIEKPRDVAWFDHDYGLIRDEDVEVLHGDRLPWMYEAGCSREMILKTLKAYMREDLNTLWPDIFPLDTT